MWTTSIYDLPPHAAAVAVAVAVLTAAVVVAVVAVAAVVAARDMRVHTTTCTYEPCDGNRNT